MSALAPVLARIDADLDDSLDRLFELLRLKSISTDPHYKPDCHATAEWLAADLKAIGFDAGVRITPGHPMVVAHHDGPAGSPHVLFYGHYDVQPVDPLELWHDDPFTPSIKDLEPGRKVITGRGSSDDKGQLMLFVEACRAWKAVHGSLPCRVSILFEGEEESGSPSLKPFLEANAQELKADFAMVCDTSMWDHETPAISTALRGLVGEEITVRAADRDLHSGEYGGAAANPIRILAKVLADIHDDTGRVTIPGFYDGVAETPAPILKSWEGLGETAETFLGKVGLSVPSGEQGRSVLELVWARPTAEFNGISGGYTGKGFKTVIAAEAHAKVSFRLVHKQDPGKDPRGFPRFRARTHPGRLLGRVPSAWRIAGHPAFLRCAVPRQCQQGPVGRMAEAGGDDRHGRLDPDRRRLPDLSQNGVAACRLCPIGRPHSFAEREIRPCLVPQGPAVLGPHPRRHRPLTRSHN